MTQSLEDCPPDKIENCPHPRAVHQLFGHESAEQSFLSAMNRNKLHHAWMITGPKGCGKASLAYRVARRLLGAASGADNGVLGVQEDDPVSRQIAAGSNPDLMAITNGWNQKTKKWRSEISIEQIRKISHFFANRAAGNGWRICIVDCADDLNHNAANALLKTLEEPPEQGLLLLVCHRPGRLLPTITSRCRHLALRNPGISIAQNVAMDCGANEADSTLAAKLAHGSPGRAAEIANGQGLELWAEITQIFDALPRFDQAKAHGLANRLAIKSAEQSRNLFLDLLQLRLEQEIQSHAKNHRMSGLDAWLQVQTENQNLQNSLTRLNLDPAMVIVQMLGNIRKAAVLMQREMTVS